MKVTMQDVAREAGVDKATVSRVLNGDHRISEKTRVKVMDAVRALNYHVDKNASNLSTNRSHLIGVVLPDFSVPWFAPFFSGLDRSVANSEYEIVLKCTDNNQFRAVRELGKLRDRNVEGVIWGDTGNPPEGISVPLLTLNFSMPGAYSIMPDKEDAQPGFEIGVLAGRLMLKLISGKPVPSREIIVRTAETASDE